MICNNTGADALCPLRHSFLEAWLDRQTASLIAFPARSSDPAPLPDAHGYRSQGSQGTHGVCGLYDTDAERGATEHRGLRGTKAASQCGGRGGDRHRLLKLGTGNLPDQPERIGSSTKDQGKRQGKGRRKEQGPSTAVGSSDWGHGWQQGSRQYQGDLLNQLSRLVIRHELQLQNVQSDTKIHLYLRTGPTPSSPRFFSIGREWGRLFRDEPQKLSLSLRETLWSPC